MNLKDSFVNKSSILHKNFYDYQKVDYVNSRSKVIIICPVHGEFEQRPTGHLSGKGCKKCGLKKSIETRTHSTDEFIKKSKKIHDKYDYSKVDYKNSSTKVIIICPVHGEFEQRPIEHLRGMGCKKCGINSTKLNLDDFILKANLLHKNKYDYSKVDYINDRSKVIIVCREHGDFTQRPTDHLQGDGCRFCFTTTSKGEQQLAEFIKSELPSDEVLQNKRFLQENTKYSFELDVFIPRLKIGFEFNGDYFHANPKIYDSKRKIFDETANEVWKKDARKEQFFTNKGIKIVTIWWSDWEKRNEETKSNILKTIKQIQ